MSGSVSTNQTADSIFLASGSTIDNMNEEELSQLSDRLEAKAEAAATAAFSETLKDVPTRLDLFEMILYGIFLIIFSMVIWNVRDPRYAFYYNDMMKDLFLHEEFPDVHIYKTFFDIATVGEMWEWMEGVALPGFFSFDDDQEALIYGTNHLVGSVRFRQVRVEGGHCRVPADFLDAIPSCYVAYDDSVVSTEPYGYLEDEGPLFNYSSPEELNSNPQQALVKKYEGGGFIQDFHFRNNTEQDEPIESFYPGEEYGQDCYTPNECKLLRMKFGGWVDRQTRAIFVDFSTFNANVNMFFVGQIYFEIPPSGGVVPGYKFRTLRLYYYAPSFTSSLQLLGEVLVGFFVFFYMMQELYELWKLRINYFGDGWNVFDICNLALFIGAIALRWKNANNFARLELLPDDPQFFNFNSIVFWNAAENNLLATNAFLLWFKIFKYTKFMSKMKLISTVLTRSSGSLTSFTLMFFFILCGFAQAGTVAFGTDLAEYRTFPISIVTLLIAMLGTFDFDALQNSNRLFGPLFFFSFIIIVFFIILSMFLAIVDKTYAEVSNEIENAESSWDAWSALKTNIQKNGIGFLKKSKGGKRMLNLIADEQRLEDIEARLRLGDADKDGKLSKREAMVALKDLDEPPEEIFAKYDLDDDGELNSEEQHALYQELAELRARKKQNIKDIVEREDFMNMEDKMHKMDDMMAILDDEIEGLTTMIAGTTASLRDALGEGGKGGSARRKRASISSRSYTDSLFDSGSSSSS